MSSDQCPVPSAQCLNPEQKRAVETTEGPVLVLSGAGTGKTSVLVARVAHILRSGCARPWEILALTFTNKAANEMKSRIANMLGAVSEPPIQVGEIWMGTFHSIALRILRRNAAAAGLRPDFLVFGEDDQRAVMKTVLANLGLSSQDYPPGDWVEKMGAEKDKGIVGACRPPHAIKDCVGTPGARPDGGVRGTPLHLHKIYDAYNAELARLNAVDFGDLILKTLELFVSHPDILLKYQRQFKYVMVDEYQDTNAAQYQMVRMLAGGFGNICCVGDDDQSIYSWRGAEIKNILNFEREYPGAKIIRLETNYRSTGAILSAANSLIKHNAGRLGKDLRPVPSAGAGEKVQIVYIRSDLDEAKMVADAIAAGTGHDTAVLIRAGSLSRPFEEEFAARRITYRLVGATKFYDRMEIRDAVAYARLLCYPFDEISFLRIIGKPRRGFGDAALAKLRDFARENGYNLSSALREMPLSGKQKSAADEFIKSFDFDWAGMGPADAIGKVLENSGYINMWRESKESDAKDRLSNVNELIGNVASRYDSLQEFLEHVALMTTEDDATPQNAAAISIMTIHAAKGLEFDTVFLPAWEEGIFPNEMAINDGGLEEERRLAYVAITRAKRRCVISCADSRMVFGRWQHNEVSRFIKEIDGAFTRESNFGMRARFAYRAPDTFREGRKSFRDDADMVGKLVRHETLGAGVVIEQDDDGEIITVAFRDKGIKKIARRFLVKE